MSRAYLEELQLKVVAAQRNLEQHRQVLAAAEKKMPEHTVGRRFVTGITGLTTPELIASAMTDARWLAERCHLSGSGAVCDSGDARIVVTLTELCNRLSGRTG